MGLFLLWDYSEDYFVSVLRLGQDLNLSPVKEEKMLFFPIVD